MSVSEAGLRRPRTSICYPRPARSSPRPTRPDPPRVGPRSDPKKWGGFQKKKQVYVLKEGAIIQKIQVLLVF